MTSPRPLRDLLRDDTDTLACGQLVDDILEQAADGDAVELTAHQQTCPHCQAALREFAQLWRPVRALADMPVSVPEAVKIAVAAQIRRLVADIWYSLELTDGGSIRVAARVVATLARDAARKVPRVRAALGRSTQSCIADLVEKATLQHRHPNAAVGVLGRTAVVDLAIAVTYGDRVDDVAREVQRRVIEELRTNVGLKDISVNVSVDDVL